MYRILYIDDFNKKHYVFTRDYKDVTFIRNRFDYVEVLKMEN